MKKEVIKDILTSAFSIYIEQCDNDAKYVKEIVKAEEILIDAINREAKIKIDLTESDLQDLMNGESFDWTYGGVDVHLFNSDLTPTECPRCIEDWIDDDGVKHNGECVESDCEECGVCSECEHMCECYHAE